jgi:tetratricopeptide (TPR) repeat protein
MRYFGVSFSLSMRGSDASTPLYGVSIERQGDRPMARGDREWALECFRRAVELIPNYVSPALTLSRLQSEDGLFQGARDTPLHFLSQANHGLDQERSARLQLAQLYEGAGYREAASAQCRDCLALQP